MTAFMEPLDYRSAPDPGPLPPATWEDAYGCFPAVLAVVLGGGGMACAVFVRAGRNPFAIVAALVAAGICLAVGWRSAVQAVRSPRGVAFGTLAVLAATAATVAAGCIALLGRH